MGDMSGNGALRLCDLGPHDTLVVRCESIIAELLTTEAAQVRSMGLEAYLKEGALAPLSQPD